MSLYDKASLVFSGKAAAGKDEVAYNIKPVEKLKVDELVTNNKLLTSDGWAFSDSNITVANGKIVFNEAAQYATARWDTDVFVEGKTYKISFKVEDFGGDASNSKLLAQQANNTQIDTNIDRDGKYSFYYTPGAPDGTSNQNKFQLKTVTDSVQAKVSDFSIKEVEQKANDFTFTRGSNLTATLEGADGLIKKGRENQLLYSNQFDTTWTAVSASITGGQQGYDGSTNAWELKAIGNGSSHLARLNQVSLDVSGVSTFSVYAKAGNVNWIRLNGLKTGTNINNYFDLSGNGAVGASPSNTVVESKIESIGSGWFRISLTSKGDYPITEVRIQVAEADGDEIPATNSYVFIQNSQLEQGLVATPYIDRTGAAYSTAGVLENEPRYDYSGGDATLLLEPERTNLSNHSEYINEFSGSRTTVTHNYGTSPEGVVNSSRMVNTTDDGGHRLYSNHFDLTLNSDYTISVFAKKGSRKIISMELMGSNESDVGFDEPIFNLDDASISGDSSNAFMEDYGNGWYRCGVTSSATSASSTGQYRMYLYLRDDTSQKSYVGSTGDNVELYGMQVEKGSYATSYIPTYGSAATREGEGDTLSSFTCTLDKPLSKKYTIFMDLQVDNLERPTTNFDDIFVARAADGNNYAFRLEGYHDPTPDPDTYSLRVFAYSTKDSRAALSSDHSNGIQLGQRNKIAIVFDDTVGVKVFLNGNSTPLKEVLVGGSFSTFPTETLQANSFYDVKFLEGGSQPRSKTLLHGVQAYDVALSDAECVSLTTI